MEKALIAEACITDFMKDIDSKINSKYTLIDSKKKGLTDAIEKFESEKLMYSLINLGVPLSISLKILNKIIDKIIYSHKDKLLETSDIRKVVSESLYESYAILDQKINPQKCRIWGDLYLRKYGNPKGPIQIIHRDGKIEDLDFELLEGDIIPYAFSDILKLEKSKIIKKFSKKERRDMGNELMRIILELGIYRIHHRTLILLTRDLAMQPPHPWVVDPDKSFEYIKYNLERADINLKETKDYYEKGNMARCRNSILETIHHTSAAIMGYYSEIPGCGLLAPFHNLVSLLEKLSFVFLHPANEVDRVESIKNEINIFGESKIWTISQDLNIYKKDFIYFYNLVTQIKHYLQISPEKESIREALPNLEEYLTISINLVYGKERLKEELNSAIRFDGDNKEKGQLFEDVVSKIFKLSDKFNVKKDVKIKNKQFDIIIEHKCDFESFLEVEKYIFVECKNTSTKADIEVIEKLGKRIEGTAKRFCNTGIIISPRGFTKAAISEAVSYFDKDILIILLKERDLYEMIEGDLIKELNTKIGMLFYGKIE
jgi:hypothetical protein